MDLRLGAGVQTTRGEPVGTLTRVLVDQVGEVEEIVVRLDAGLGVDEVLSDASEVRVPTELVVEATERGVTLNATADELQAYPEYVEERPPRRGERWSPPPGYTVSDLLGRLALLLGGGANIPLLQTEYNKPEGEHQISPHAPALVGDTRVGEITRVLYDSASGRVQALVLRGTNTDAEYLLPAELLEAVADDAVLLRADAERIAQLPRFQP
jgi:sporulation protein YlmC with PRC-barrel domain